MNIYIYIYIYIYMNIFYIYIPLKSLRNGCNAPLKMRTYIQTNIHKKPHTCMADLKSVKRLHNGCNGSLKMRKQTRIYITHKYIRNHVPALQPWGRSKVYITAVTLHSNKTTLSSHLYLQSSRTVALIDPLPRVSRLLYF